MKTNFLAILVVALGTLTLSLRSHASSPPALDAAGNSLELAPASTLASSELQPGPATIAGRNVNIRAKATVNSELIVQMQDGETVFVEEVILRAEATGKDPNRWAKIAYPTNATAWVHSQYVDATAATVKAKKLHVRAGPGENHAIVGTLQSGDAVKSIGRKGDWLQIEPPTGTTAYVAAKLLRQVAPAAVTQAVGTETPPTESTVVTDQPAVAAGGEATVPEMEPVTAAAEGATTVTDTAAQGTTDLAPLPEPAPALETVPAEPLPPRIVDREGVVRSFTSIQAPSNYKLVSPDNGKTINYLHTTSTNLDLKRYVGLHIIATGEESLDRRWPNMPVLTLKKIVLVE